MRVFRLALDRCHIVFYPLRGVDGARWDRNIVSAGSHLLLLSCGSAVVNNNSLLSFATDMVTVSADDLLHEVTTGGSSSDVKHKQPIDGRDQHVWLFEPPASQGVLTQDGLTQIVFHKYHAGTYTMLDNFLNPYWTYLTECLPMNMAPNLVTALGGMHCVVAYFITWIYLPSFDTLAPNWLLLLNGYCTIAYYTFDCMDGKQARRTGSSSPLGQLFDHGMDCFCLLAHLSTAHTWAMGGNTPWFWASQAALQFSFFVAQWEEYYTGILPHANGQFGVTEVNYGQALLSVINAFVDRKVVYTAASLAAIGTAWPAMMTYLIFASIFRVCSVIGNTKGRFSALSKLTSPLIVSIAPFYIPSVAREREVRFIHLTIGLALCLVTIKIIVFSMAKQSYAVIQGDILPCLLAAAWVRHDVRLTEAGSHLLWQVLSVWYFCRMLYWTNSFIQQVCERLDINLFTIKLTKKKKD
uniref:Ethanolaminephosphotransferase n=1 Tax=Phaeodactylum tricornutum TaxID=2850 RepID=A0A8J9SFD7_PHATR